MEKNEPPDVLTNQEIVELYNNFDYKHRGLSATAFIEAAQKPNTIIFDLRPIDRYQLGHIKGAVHLGADVTIEKLNQLAPDYNSTILVYCSNSLEPTRMVPLTHTIAPQIYGLGYKNIYFLDAAWRDKEVIPWEGKIKK